MYSSRALLTACWFVAGLQFACAGSVITVTLDTTTLVGHSAGPFYFTIALTDGNGFGDRNNILTISNVDFGGGHALGAPFIFGGASGSLETAIALTDIEFVSYFSEQFVPGSQLAFVMDLTANEDGGGIPDGFTFSLLDNSGSPIPTLAIAGDYLFGGAIDATGPLFEVFGSDPERSAAGIDLGPPTITDVPEPTCSGLVILVIVLSVVRARRLNGSCKKLRVRSTAN